MTRYTMFSAGQGSFRAAKIDRAEYPDAHQRLVFVDTLYEDADAYRYLVEAAANVFERPVPFAIHANDFPDYQVPLDTPIAEYAGNPEWRAFLTDLRRRTVEAFPDLVWLADGRDPWEVFRDSNYLGNTRVDNCSRTLKRLVLDKWRRENCDPAADVFAVGIGEDERHRLEGGKGKRGLRARMADMGWVYHAPLLGNPYSMPSYRYAPLDDVGPAEPRLYVKGYKHNNCGGFCVKAGHAHWQNRWRADPERYAYDAAMERKLRDYIGTPAATILRDRRNGNRAKPMSLDVFGRRFATGPDIEYEPGASGCGCLTDE